MSTRLENMIAGCLLFGIALLVATHPWTNASAKGPDMMDNRIGIDGTWYGAKRLSDEPRYGGAIPMPSAGGAALAPAGTVSANGLVYSQVMGLGTTSCDVCGTDLTVPFSACQAGCPCGATKIINSQTLWKVSGKYEGHAKKAVTISAPTQLAPAGSL